MRQFIHRGHVLCSHIKHPRNLHHSMSKLLRNSLLNYIQPVTTWFKEYGTGGWIYLSKKDIMLHACKMYLTLTERRF